MKINILRIMDKYKNIFSPTPKISYNTTDDKIFFPSIFPQINYDNKA